MTNKRKQLTSNRSLAQQYATQFGVEAPASSGSTIKSKHAATTDALGSPGVSKNPLVSFQGGGADSSHVRNDIQTCQGDNSLPFVLVEMKHNQPSRLSDVKVLSPKAPDIGRIKYQRHSSTADPKMKIARTSDIDTSKMSTIDRTIIKLRQWKARILAEPPPVVEIRCSDAESVARSTTSQTPTVTVTGHERKIDKLASQLKFANGCEDGRLAMRRNIPNYAERCRHGRLRKKEFAAVPRALQENSENH